MQVAGESFSGWVCDRQVQGWLAVAAISDGLALCKLCTLCRAKAELQVSGSKFQVELKPETWNP
jgi:hypothetical protein